jgi:hypothetical protein
LIRKGHETRQNWREDRIHFKRKASTLSTVHLSKSTQVEWDTTI